MSLLDHNTPQRSGVANIKPRSSTDSLSQEVQSLARMDEPAASAKPVIKRPQQGQPVEIADPENPVVAQLDEVIQTDKVNGIVGHKAGDVLVPLAPKRSGFLDELVTKERKGRDTSLQAPGDKGSITSVKTEAFTIKLVVFPPRITGKCSSLVPNPWSFVGGVRSMVDIDRQRKIVDNICGELRGEFRYVNVMVDHLDDWKDGELLSVPVPVDFLHKCDAMKVPTASLESQMESVAHTVHMAWSREYKSTDSMATHWCVYATAYYVVFSHRAVEDRIKVAMHATHQSVRSDENYVDRWWARTVRRCVGAFNKCWWSMPSFNSHAGVHSSVFDEIGCASTAVFAMDPPPRGGDGKPGAGGVPPPAAAPRCNLMPFQLVHPDAVAETAKAGFINVNHDGSRGRSHGWYRLTMRSMASTTILKSSWPILSWTRLFSPRKTHLCALGVCMIRSGCIRTAMIATRS